MPVVFEKKPEEAKPVAKVVEKKHEPAPVKEEHKEVVKKMEPEHHKNMLVKKPDTSSPNTLSLMKKIDKNTKPNPP